MTNLGDDANRSWSKFLHLDVDKRILNMLTFLLKVLKGLRIVSALLLIRSIQSVYSKSISGVPEKLIPKELSRKSDF